MGMKSLKMNFEQNFFTFKMDKRMSGPPVSKEALSKTKIQERQSSLVKNDTRQKTSE